MTHYTIRPKLYGVFPLAGARKKVSRSVAEYSIRNIRSVKCRRSPSSQIHYYVVLYVDPRVKLAFDVRRVRAGGRTNRAKAGRRTEHQQTGRDWDSRLACLPAACKHRSYCSVTSLPVGLSAVR